MFCRVISADIQGISAQMINVESDISGGLPTFNMVGLLSSEVREAKERVSRAIINSGFNIPSRRITINLSPASVRKNGTGFDLAIAVSILACLNEISLSSLQGKMFVGELSLDGSVNKVNGILPVALMAKEAGIHTLIVPMENAFEGAVIEGLSVCGVSSLKDAVSGLQNNSLTEEKKTDLKLMLDNAFKTDLLDYKDIKGQQKAKRATMIAAAGFHNLLYIGPPGSGKSMMASRIPSIFNNLSVEECLEISKIYSVMGMLENNSLVLNRPFRAPHHSITKAALIGGMGNPKPGEITLAHKGILFLDEAAEFKKENIELLRQPLEDKKILISRAKQQIVFPADFMLVMAMNPCKCGYYPDRNQCRCSQSDVDSYMAKIRGPVLDRVDICAGTSRLKINEINSDDLCFTSEAMRKVVLNAQKIQKKRFRDEKIDFNSQMSKQQIEKYCPIDDQAKLILESAFEKLNMTARGYYKILKVARTIADTEGAEIIEKKHIIEAVGYRNNLLDK